MNVVKNKFLINHLLEVIHVLVIQCLDFRKGFNLQMKFPNEYICVYRMS